jgi:branched-chain amino acid transport system permease protein
MQILLNGLIVGSAYALIGIGFSLLYSTVRYFHLAYGMVGIMAAYVAYSLMNIGVGFGFALLGAGAAGALLGVLCYFLLFQPMSRRKCSNLVILVASFGLLIVLQNVTALIWGNATKSISLTDTIQKGYEFFGLIITANQLMIAAVAVGVMILLELFLQRTKYGMAIRAIGDNQELTKVLGLKTEQIIVVVFLIASFMSAISATLISLEIGLRPTYGILLVLKAIIASIIGGLGSVRGALLGGMLLGVSENLGIYFIGGQWENTVAFSLLALFLLFRPEGLFAKQKLLSIR